VFPHEPREGNHSAVGHLLTVSGHCYPLTEYMDASQRRRLKHPSAFFPFEEGELAEHRHLAPCHMERSRYKFFRQTVGRVRHHIIRRVLARHHQEVHRSFSVATIYQVGTFHRVVVFFQHSAYRAVTTRALPYFAVEVFAPQESFGCISRRRIEVVSVSARRRSDDGLTTTAT